MEDNKKAVIYAVIACLIWGTVYVAVKVGLNHGMRPLTFAGVRFFVGGLILLGFSYFNGGLGRLGKRDFMAMAALGMLQTGAQNALFFKGVELTNAGVSAIFINTSPFFVILMAPLFFRDSKITARRLAGLVIGFGGVLLTAFRPGLFTKDYELGITFLTLSAMTWAASNIAAKKIMVRSDPLTVTGVQMTAGAVPLIAAGVITEGNGLASADGIGFAVLAYLVVFATSIPFLSWYKALNIGEVGKVSIFAFMLPVLGVVSGWLLLGEPLTGSIALGMAAVAIGIVLVNIK